MGKRGRRSSRLTQSEDPQVQKREEKETRPKAPVSRSNQDRSDSKPHQGTAEKRRRVMHRLRTEDPTVYRMLVEERDAE